MKPVWIKYYGLIPMTRRGYLTATWFAGLFAVVACAIAFGLGLAHDRLPPLNWPGLPPAGAETSLGSLLYYNIYWILLGLFIAEGIDIFVTLRKFSQKEAAQQAELASAVLAEEVESQPDSPSETGNCQARPAQSQFKSSEPKEAAHRAQFFHDNRNPE